MTNNENKNHVIQTEMCVCVCLCVLHISYRRVFLKFFKHTCNKKRKKRNETFQRELLVRLGGCLADWLFATCYPYDMENNIEIKNVYFFSFLLKDGWISELVV